MNQTWKKLIEQKNHVLSGSFDQYRSYIFDTEKYSKKDYVQTLYLVGERISKDLYQILEESIKEVTESIEETPNPNKVNIKELKDSVEFYIKTVLTNADRKSGFIDLNSTQNLSWSQFNEAFLETEELCFHVDDRFMLKDEDDELIHNSDSFLNALKILYQWTLVADCLNHLWK